MGEVTGIAWTHHTANFWIGCERVSEACDFCYADRDSKRLAAQHGLKLWEGDRYITKTAASNVLQWNKRAEAAGERRRVFCMSFGDLMEDRLDLEPIRQSVVWPLIPKCLWLDFLILTKRPENFRRMLPAAWLATPLPNVWLGTTCENQEWANVRVPLLLQTPAAVRFVSYEPALGPVDFGMINDGSWYDREGANSYDALRGTAYHFAHGHYDHGLGGGPKLDWVIVGGESGPKARPFDIGWAKSTVEQCRAAGVAAFVKQLGARPFAEYPDDGLHVDLSVKLQDRHGSDWDEWPTDIPRVREFPA